MKLMPWNCRGLGRTSTIQSLRRLVWSYSPNGLFLMETKASAVKMQWLGHSLDFENLLFIERGNGGEGLALFWSDFLSWNVIYSSNWVIGVNTTSKHGVCLSFWLRNEFWKVLSELVMTGNKAWACIGDFNDVLDQSKKLGGRPVTNKSNFPMRNFIYETRAFDLGFIGNNFTWCYKKGGNANIREMLDRTLVSQDWRLCFEHAGVIHLNAANSDHVPILVCESLDHTSLPKPFRFLEAWTRDPSCEMIINDVWNISNSQSGWVTFGARVLNNTKALKV